MKKINILTTAFLLIFLPSCATKFTTAQREGLSTLAITRTEVKSDAYAEPYGGDSQVQNQAGMIGVSSQTGAIGGLVGSLVGETIAATQNNMFRGKSKGSFAAVQANTPEVGSIMNTQLVSGVKREPFYGSRIRNVSPNSITSKITSYRLTRSGKDKNGDLLLAPQLIVEMKLNDASGKALAKGTYIGTGYSNPISVYASSASKSKEGYEMAAKMATDQFTTVLAKIAAE
jgi:hypothetical protein